MVKKQNYPLHRMFSSIKRKEQDRGVQQQIWCCMVHPHSRIQEVLYLMIFPAELLDRLSLINSKQVHIQSNIHPAVSLFHTKTSDETDADERLAKRLKIPSIWWFKVAKLVTF